MRQSLFCLLFLSLSYSVTSQFWTRTTRQDNSCVTPDSKSGTCVNLRKCPPLLDLLVKQRNDPTVADYLRRSVCGYEGRDPKVCCPTTRTPDANNGGDKAGSSVSNLPSPPQCGIAESGDHTRIVGGQPADLGAWPWIAALGYKSNTRPGPIWLCGGALVHTKYIITAAHCTKHPSLQLYLARLGELDLNNNIQDGANPFDVRIEKALAHPKYSTTKKTDDIALLKLADHVPLNKFIQPICLPAEPQLRSQNFVKNWPFVAGWGSLGFRGNSTTRLMEVQLPVVSNDDCKKAYTGKANIELSQLCAGFTTGQKDACQGDSGGPLMWPRSRTYYLIGVVSFGFKCAEPGYPGVYARVTEYVDWISKNMN